MTEPSMLYAALLLFLVMDPIGNVPLFVSILKDVDPERRGYIVIREMIIALVFLLAFLASGRLLLDLLGISDPSLSIAGGILLFMIAIRMVFPKPQPIFETDGDSEPLVVPLAIPLIAGPSAIATILVILGSAPSRWPEWLGALLIAWSVSGAILFSAAKLSRRIGKRALTAMERLMGMVVVIIAVEMLVQGVDAMLTLQMDAWIEAMRDSPD